MLIVGCNQIESKPYNAEITTEKIEGSDLASCVELGDYKKIEVDPVEPEEVTKEDIQVQIDYQLEKVGVTELTQDNVNKITGCDTVAAFEEQLRESLEKQAQNAAKNEQDNKVWDAVLEDVKVLKYPNDMIEQELVQVKANFQSFASAQSMTLDEILETMDMTQNDIEEQAKDYVKSDMTIYAIAKQENISLSEEEYQKETDKLKKALNYITEKELITRYGSEENMRFEFLANKVFRYVVDHAVIK